MSKKQLRSRLDNLFAEIDAVAQAQPDNLLHLSTAWTWEADENGIYTQCGAEVVESLGIQPDDLIGHSLADHPLLPEYQPVVRAALTSGLFPIEIEVKYKTAAGSLRPVRLALFAQPAVNGSRGGYRGISQPVNLGQEIESIPGQKEVTRVDTPPKTGQLTARPTSTLRSQASMKNAAASPPDIGARRPPPQQDIAARPGGRGQPTAIQVPVNLNDYGPGLLEIVDENRTTGWNEEELLLVQEVAHQLSLAIESAQAYQLAQKAYEEMREIDRLKSQFLANMSHELRTPLNSIIGFSRVILKGIDGPINDIQQQDLTSIYNSGQHLLGLINDVLDLSKIEAGKMELQFEEIHIGDLINSVMSTAVGLVKDKPIKLFHNLDPDLPAVVADATRIRQVLLNFLSNAAKFTNEGSITVQAIKTTSPEGTAEIMVTVTDTGEGIAEKDRDKLFQPFSQVDDSPTRKTGGTGLGLSICRSFIEMHGGRIGLLRSEIGKGSTFFFTLPIVQKETVIEPQPVTELSTCGRTILAIDDDIQVINLYQRYLQPGGYQVAALTQPARAVERAREIKPFAITLDIMMPEQDGWQVIHALKSDPDTRNIPIIICSILEQEEKGFSLGAADYLVKPFLQEDLINAIFRLKHSGRIKRILVVDDREEDQRLITAAIAEQGQFETITAGSGKEALRILDTFQPDVIVLDLFMPEMDGFEVLTALRASPSLSRIPVLILSGADLTQQEHRQLAEFGQQMLQKTTLRETEFLIRLEEVLNSLNK